MAQQLSVDRQPAIVPQPVAQLKEKRKFAKVSQLVRQIPWGHHQRQGKAIDNFSLTLSNPQSGLAKETLKNPYNFDFLTLGRDAHERDLETALTHGPVRT